MTLRRKISWLFVFGAVAGIIAIVLHDRFVAGPVYAGAPLNVWLRMLDDRQNPDKARQTIRQLGPPALPLIEEWLDWKDSLLRRALNAWVAGDQRHFDFQTLGPKDRRRLALEACDALGPAAEPAIPKLLALATAPNPELDAPYLIARIGGSNALPALERAAAGTNKFIRAAARVSADLLRSNSPTLVPYAAAKSESLDYADRLGEYHDAVVEAINSSRFPNDVRR